MIGEVLKMTGLQAKEMRSSTRMKAGDAPKKSAMAELVAARQQRDDRKSGKPEVREALS